LLFCEAFSFTSMEDRHARIAEAHIKTFNWIFDSHLLPSNDIRKRIKLNVWLQAKGGIFWVSGKAGSGKSTLMKWLYDDPRTAQNLRVWAQGSNLATKVADLVIASFYLCNAGTDLQKSQQGLLRSLLYEILRTSPDLIPEICLEHWDAANKSVSLGYGTRRWSSADLTAAFGRLQNAPTNKKFCFFIDGLDEYDGDHLDLIEIVRTTVKSPDIKLCLSSRPWNSFEDAFGTIPERKLYLQDLTREDIKIYAKAKLTIPSLISTKEGWIHYQSFILEIADRAQGVVLWVYLVVRFLRDGLVDGDDINLLQKRLRSLPTDLELFFKHILASCCS
jgi:hypothetical protein